MIKYKATSSQIAGGGDYQSSIIIYSGDREIAHASDGEELTFEGDFRDYQETGKTDKLGSPEVKHKSFSLDIQDLIALQRILLWWIYDDKEPTDLELNPEKK